MVRVLIADDDPEYRAAFCEAMLALGHEVSAVESGNAVVPALQDNPVDIVFLDILMADGGGISALHDVTKAFPRIPVVLVTGHAIVQSSPLFQEGLHLASAKLTKSASLLDLDATIRSLTPRERRG
ncbi:response regulator [Rhodobacterales bacterium HKCCE2091]|nr:response regulator [Rhodobacterales bacterium HKCCE2091]